MATIIAALEHSKPTPAHYPEPVKRHADALAHARAFAARQAGAQGMDPGQLREKLTKLTRRNEFISGQSFSYVQLDDVRALIDQLDAAPGVGNG